MRTLTATIESITALGPPTTTVKAASRTIKTAWVIATGTNEHGEATRVEAQLTTSHWKDGKVYGSSLQRVTVTEGPVFTSEAFWMFSGTAIARKRVARHSAKLLEAAHNEALEVLAAGLLAEIPKVLAQFEPELDRDELMELMRS